MGDAKNPNLPKVPTLKTEHASLHEFWFRLNSIPLEQHN
jgi:hypothetical protein